MADKEQIKAIIKQYADKGMNNFHKALKDDGKEAVTTKYWDGFSDCANLLLLEIDSLQKEPKECIYSKDNYTDEDRKVLCDGCEIKCRFNKKEDSVNNGLDLGCGVIWRDKEPVSESLEEAANNFLTEFYGVGEPHNPTDIGFFKAGANWQKEQLLAKAAVNGYIDAFPYAEGIKVMFDNKRQDLMDKFKVGDKVKVIVIKQE